MRPFTDPGGVVAVRQRSSLCAAGRCRKCAGRFRRSVRAGRNQAPGAEAALENRFLADDNSEDLLWAVTDALLELSDPGLTALVSTHMDRPDRQQQIAYLIGKLGSARVDSSEYRFLHQHLLSGDFALRDAACRRSRNCAIRPYWNFATNG